MIQKTRPYIVLGFFLFLLIFFVSFAEKSVKNQVCNDVVIRIFPGNTNQFLDKQDVINSIAKSNGGPLTNTNMRHVHTKKMEEDLRNNNFVENADVYFDLKGNLYVDVYHRKPVLRIISSEGRNYYIDKNGVHMPLSEKHSSHILVSTGYIEKASRNSEFEKDLFLIADYLKNDDFLYSLIGQIHVKYNGELLLVPKIEDFIIEFGRIENIELKFKKLKILYKEILPYEGWNKYNKADLRYSNQIVLNKK
jgi:cell division protein FtsQ